MSVSLSLFSRLDRGLIWTGGQSVRYLVVQVQAPELESAPGASRVPLNLALVIDASGSMSGAPLGAAKEAASGVVARLADGDALSLVSFDNNVAVHASGLLLDGEQRTRAAELIAAIEPGGSTNLSGGWLAGAKCVSDVMNGDARLRNRVVLLSDGKANAGIIQPEILEHHAAQLAARGIFTSTVGIGDNYSPPQLHAIAEHGGGRMHDAEHPHEIVEVVLAELDDMLTTVAEAVTIELALPAGVAVECVSKFPTVLSPGKIESRIGSLIARASRKAVFKLTFPAGSEGVQVSIETRCRWSVPGSSETLIVAPVMSILEFAESAENHAQARDLETSLLVAQTWQAAIVRHVTQLNIEGALPQARDYLDKEVPFFVRYCDGIPGAEALVAQLRSVTRASERQWSARVSKEVLMAMTEVNFNRISARRLVRQDWTSYVKREERSETDPGGATKL